MPSTSKSTSREWRSFPVLRLDKGGPVGAAFLERGVGTLAEALDFVWALPYGRNAEPADPLAPLAEGRGTSATKHALLLRLSREVRFVVSLRLAFFMVDANNTPQVARVLKDSGLSHYPEARCFLRRADRRIDVTHPGLSAAIGPAEFFGEETIRPEQVLEYKTLLHRGVVERWARSDEAEGRSFEEIWAVRERCVAALSESMEERSL